MKPLWIINRYKDPNFGDIGICRALSEFLIDNGYQIRNFDFIGKKVGFQFTRTIFITMLAVKAIKEKPPFMVIGGGQLLLNNRSFPYAMLGWYLVSKISRVPLLVFSVGTEKNSKASLFYNLILKLFLNQAKLVYLRDSISQQIIYQITGLLFDTVPDAVYLSRKDKSPDQRLKCTKTLIFVSKQPKRTLSIEDYFNQFLDVLNKQNGIADVIISASSMQDLNTATEFSCYAEKLGYTFKLEIPRNFEQFLTQIENANTVISSRMHPLIYAHLLGKNFNAIGINQKTKSMALFLNNNSAEFLAKNIKIKLLESLNRMNAD